MKEPQQREPQEDNESTISSQSQNTLVNATIQSLDNKNEKTVDQIFKERVSKWKKLEMKKMSLSDQLDFRDPQNVSEFSQAIYENMKKQELENMVNPDYLQKVQTDIKDTSRAFLIEWIIDVHRKFRLVPEALYVTQFIIDQYMSRKKIEKSQLHLLGVSTLLIATKYEEIYPPDLTDFLQVSENKFSKDTVLNMEKDILMTLNFKITSPSPYRFLQRFRRLSVAFNDDEVFFYAQYLQEISLLDATLLKFRPSMVAASALILASKQLQKKNCWNKEVENFTGYSESDLQEAIAEVKQFAVEINPKFIQTLRYKFSKPEYNSVAKLQFKF